jgi:zinc transport system ATP-binding protein
MLLDEPVNGLDPIAASELYSLIRHLNRDRGMTILMVSHDMHSAVHEAGVILHMDTKVLFFGTREEYLRSEAGKRFIGGCALCQKAVGRGCA